MGETLTGRLLVASPLLEDPNFFRTVVLVCAHGDAGAMGVVLNRPLDVSVSEHLPRWSERAALPGAIFSGGPVEPRSAVGVALAGAPPAGDGWTAIDGNLGLIDLGADPEVYRASLRQVRIFAGYAGWSPGQLEAEVAEQAWFVVRGTPSDALCDRPDELWRAVLRRQPLDLAMYATFPDRDDLN